MYTRVSKYLSLAIALAFVLMIPITLAAQVTAKSTGKAAANDSASKWDIFLGYSYLAPRGSVVRTDTVPNQAGSYDSVSLGEIASVSYFFNKYVGVQAEVGIHEWGSQSTGAIGTHGNDDGFTTVGGGVIVRNPTATWTPFAHVVVGGAMVDGPVHNPFTWGPSFALGGGLDYRLNHHFSIRLIQADYEYMRAGFPAAQGGTVDINSARLSAGVVFNAGSIAPPPPVTLSCSASPTTIYAGDPVTVTATAGGLSPKMNVVYSWGGTGVTGSGPTASVATAMLAPGSYTVTCGVKEGPAGKEGVKPWETADSSTNFTVKAFDPPTINCSAAPATIKPGETSTITASGVSPQNRPLTYSYSATAGTVEGNGASATYSSTGVPTGTTNITCNVADDKGHTATANASVTVLEPYKAPVEPAEVKQLESRLALHSVFFPTNLPTAANPKGGLLASQEGTLTTLASDFKKYLVYRPEAHLTLTGHADVRGSVEFNQALSERRVARTKAYLVEQGVPEASIETRGLGKGENLTAAQVKELVEHNPDLSAAELGRVLHDLGVIVWAQNRRVDVTLSTTGQQSVRLYPFNAADALTLIGKKTAAPVKKATGSTVKKPVPHVKK